MTKFLIVLALSVFTTQGSVIKNDGSRKARSAPPDFHTQQWSGILRSADGSQQGVFSGAAASSRDDTQAVGQAFSLAGAGNTDSHPIVYPGLVASHAQKENQSNAAEQSGSANQENVGEHAKEPGLQSRFGGYSDASAQSSANTFGSGQSGYSSQSNSGAQANAKSTGNEFAYGSQGQGNTNAYGSGQPGYGSQPNAEAYGNHGCHRCAGTHSDKNYYLHGSQGNRESYTFGPKPNENQGNTGSYSDISKPGENYNSYESQRREDINAFGPGHSGFANQADSGAQTYDSRPSSNFGNQGNGGNYPGSQQSASYTPNTSSGQYGYENQPSASLQPNSNGNQDHSAGQSGSYEDQPPLAQSGGYGDQPNVGANAVGTQQPNSQDHQSAQSALQGALGLAYQGLQAQQAPCTTCGKSNYAYSNAKTHSGNAIALSVNG
ncbi:hypothetical protein O0L34_g14782 [Tuta absoluta]|nr:hypothetical protein O0L34_g14782 [Tuta absoluta]